MIARGRKPAAVLDVFDYRRLREVRKEMGITTTEIEKNVYPEYHSIENGRRIPSLTVFSEICQYLDLDPFTVAAILRLPCMPPAKFVALRAISKRHKTTLNQIMQEFVDAI